MIYNLDTFLSNESQSDRAFMQFLADITGHAVFGMANEIYYPRGVLR